MPLSESLTINIVKRYVLWHDTRGVYLGTGNWSLVNPGAIDHAPTFTEAELPRAISWMESYTKVVCKDPVRGDEVRPREVWPDVPGRGRVLELVSVEAVKRAGMPGWEPAKE